MPFNFKKINMFVKRWAILSLFSYFSLSLFGQDVGNVEIEQVYAKEHYYSIFFNTSGFGIGYKYGWTPNYSDQHLLDFDFYYSNHEKAVKGSNMSFEGARSFSYGKLYDVFFFRTGYKFQHTTHHKPYWGGVEIGYFMSGGFSLGIGLPTYLEIAYLSPNGYDLIYLVERYDPTIHDLSNIAGGAAFYERFHDLAFRPGAYGKIGLLFDFASDDDRVRSLEIGLSVDAIFPSIQQMAFNDPKKLFLEAYIAYNFGSKKLLYEK
jgi:hypothetical protein